MFIMALVGAFGYALANYKTLPAEQPLSLTGSENRQEDLQEDLPAHPFSIEALRERSYPGSDIAIHETLEPGRNYQRYLASYQSDGLKIYGLLTVPNGTPPPGGFPAIVFNHGSIPPAQYKTTEKYVAYVDGFARSGYVVFKIDYRGHGQSEGQSISAWYSPDYIIDVLNAAASLEKYNKVNPEKIGLWGHSMGGHLTVGAMVVSPKIKAGVIWAGLTATHDAVFDSWRNRRRPNNTTAPSNPTQWAARNPRQELVDQYGTWQENPEFWSNMAPTTFLEHLSGPIELHHGLNDERVDVRFSEDLKGRIEAAGKTAELFTYPNTDHNMSQSFGTAVTRSIKFFDKYLK